MSTDLEWILLSKYNSFMVKGVPEGPIFSKEPGNLRNIHSQKYSGLANPQVLDIHDKDGQLFIRTRKADAPIHHNKSAYETQAIRPRSSRRRVAGVIAKRVGGGDGYRDDLFKEALARGSALQSAQQTPRPLPPKKVRGKKAKETKA